MIPKVSVITPCYNAELTLAETIESVLAQTFQDWEMLIVDDCSTDGSAGVAKRYASHDSRIKYFRTDAPSGSPSLPRNIGLDNATGEYIAFLDSDDLWLPTKLAEQILFAKKTDHGFIYSDYEKMDWMGIRNDRKILMPEKSSFWSVLESCTIPCLTVMLRRDIIGDTRFKEIPKEDFAFWLDILRKGIQAYNTGRIHALYREQKSSRSSNKLEMIRQQWHVLRSVQGCNRFLSTYFTSIYLFKGFFKYIR